MVDYEEKGAQDVEKQVIKMKTAVKVVELKEDRSLFA